MSSSGNGNEGRRGAHDNAVLLARQYIWPGDLTEIPDWVYTDETIYKREIERIFHGPTWNYVALEAEVPNAGDFIRSNVGPTTVVVVRAKDGSISVVENRCVHRAAEFCRELSGTVNELVCPYHQWSYDFNGALVAAPHLSAATGFKKQDFHLYPVGADTWGGFVFLNLTPAGAKPLAAQLDGIPDRLQRYPLRDLCIGATIRYEIAANWKILCENYNECYHCSGVHPELCAVVPSFREAGGANLDWSRGIPHREGAYTFTHSGTTVRRAFPGLDADEQVRHKGELVYPNLFLSVACDHVAAYILQPRGAERTDITCHFLFETHEMSKPGFDPSDAVDFWDLVNRQDWSVCESVQEGIRARVHAHGYYAPMEDWNLDIRRYVTDRIGADVPA